MRQGRLRTGIGRAGMWLALLALYGQVLAGFAPAPAAWPGWERAAICHAGDGQRPGHDPGPADRSHRHCLLPCALCADAQAPLPLLAAPPALPLPRVHAAGVQPRAPPAASAVFRAALPPARAPPLA